MIEIRLHGRGGQGTVVASKVLADAVFKEGKFVQAFPFFGVERRGAPVAAFIRIDDRPVRIRNEIYEPDHVVVLDETLIATGLPAKGLKEGGVILINTPLSPDKFSVLGRFRVCTVDASRIAVEHHLGTPASPIVNTSILGALVRVLKICSIESLSQAIIENVHIKPEANAKAAKVAFESVKIA